MLARVLAFALCTTPLLSAAHASQTGISGRSGKYTRSCQSCHTGGDFEVAIGLSGPIVLFTNQRGTYTVTITTNGTANAAGFNAAVENQAGASVTNDPDTDPRDDDDGTLFALELGTQLQLGEVTHTAPRDTDESGTAQFRFDWAPNEPGRYTIYAAGNAVDKAGTAQNDQSSLLTDTVQVTVCDDDDVDGVCNDGTDNCPDTPNPDLGSGQPDCDGDGVGDACDASCSAEPSCAGLCFPGTCGDGLVDSSLAEECDDGNTNDDGNGCGPTCLRVNDCGNSIVEPAFETCDDGSGNSDTQPDACRSDCQQAYCGDGVIDTGEACDDGNTIDDGNGCSADCNINSVCGDGVVQDVTENCDDGNTIDDGDGCSAECIFNNVCGDGQLESAAEECDDGNAADDGNGCSENCENNAVCGDGITATLFETCDDGNTVDDGNGCDDRCLRNDFCGNGLRERLFEACDDGDANSNTTPNACRTDCSRNRCGDGVVDVDEECDSGNANSDTLIDACRADCTTSRCGDGVVDTGEFCDEGTLNSPIDGDRCRMTCVLPACGDGVVDAIAGEACDDGDLTDGDGCSSTCQNEACGDGVVNGSEECDDGSANSDAIPSACRTRCLAAFCGDGVVDNGEQCDDGEGNSDRSADACRRDCRVARCGDGVVDTDEQCDIGADPTTCRNDCTSITADTGCRSIPSGDAVFWIALVSLWAWRRRLRTQGFGASR